MVLKKKSFLSIPRGRVNSLNPLGHSGHLRLHEVVGSKEIETGKPHCTGFFINLVI
jgi:hypothetical protein